MTHPYDLAIEIFGEMYKTGLILESYMATNLNPSMNLFLVM